jgi:hypothetical protein
MDGAQTTETVAVHHRPAAIRGQLPGLPFLEGHSPVAADLKGQEAGPFRRRRRGYAHGVSDDRSATEVVHEVRVKDQLGRAGSQRLWRWEQTDCHRDIACAAGPPETAS